MSSEERPSKLAGAAKSTEQDQNIRVKPSAGSGREDERSQHDAGKRIGVLAAAATPFDFQGRAVRTVYEDGQVWFGAADVCVVLDIVNSRDAVSRLEDDERRIATADTLGGDQELSFINESGLYSLIFTSRKPQAKLFRRWVTGEVLPAVRRTGEYRRDDAEGQSVVDGPLQITLPGVGRYIITARPGKPPHIRETEFGDMVPELDALEGQVMACALITTSAFWQMVQQLHGIGIEPAGRFAAEKLERAILDGALMARRFMRFAGANTGTPPPGPGIH